MRRSLRFLLFLVGALACSLSAHAFAPWGQNTDYIPTSSPGNWVPGPGASNTYGTGRTVPTANGPKWTTDKTLPFKPSTKATFGTTFSPASMAKAFAKPAAAMAMGAALQKMAEMACVQVAGGSMSLAPGGQWEECKFKTTNVALWRTGGYPDTDSLTKAESCNKYARSHSNPASSSNYGTITNDYGTQMGCRAYTSTGAYINIGAIAQAGTQAITERDGWKPATADRVEEAATTTLTQWTQADFSYGYENPGSRPFGAPPVTTREVMQELMNGGQKVDGTLEAPVPQTPVLEPPVQTTRTGSDGQTITSTEQTKNDYSCLVITGGAAVQCSQTKTTTTNTASTSTPSSPATTTTTVVTKTGDPAPDPVDYTFTDTALPAQPTLYEPKYPNGLSGLWDAKVAALKATPLFQLPSVLAPNLGDSHGCPVWNLSMNLGRWDWGSHNVSPPCFVWTFLRLCIIIGALFLARALIFGG